MASVLIDGGECFVSHDVVSLFTNAPISEALEIIRNQLENDKKLKDRTNLETDDIMELLEFVVTTTSFTFWGVIYQQRFGTAMGSPVSPIIANLFMEWLVIKKRKCHAADRASEFGRLHRKHTVHI